MPFKNKEDYNRYKRRRRRNQLIVDNPKISEMSQDRKREVKARLSLVAGQMADNDFILKEVQKIDVKRKQQGEKISEIK